MHSIVAPIVSLVLSLALIPGGIASGMVPQSTIVVVEESSGEGIIEIKNTDSFPNLLITKIEDIEDDKEALITVFPPVVRVEGNEIQTVRFLMDTPTPLKTERLKRVTFEGVPPKNKSLDKEINVTFKQNLPVIIRPAGLAKNNAPWTGLVWSTSATELTVSNPTPYVVRFISPQVLLLPKGISVTLPKSYILPHQTFALKAKSDDQLDTTTVKTARFYPATTWGFSTKSSYDSPVKGL